ncbi:MAG: carbohydrate kinase [Treponema sp.]|jgi:L-xylulokinase|nr:carbohydrate kinase [Treponema sp.]
MDCILAIDIGSSTLKCVLFDLEGYIVHIERSPCELEKRKGGVVERDPETIWSFTADLLVRVNEAVRDKRHRVLAVTCTGAGDGLLMLDKAGVPISPAISSLDTRAASILREWEAAPQYEEYYAIAGESPYSGTPAALLKWYKQHDYDTYTRSHSIVFIKDWIKYRLTGRICTDYSDSSATLTDTLGVYRKEIFELLDIQEAYGKTVPQVPSQEIAGRVSSELAERLPCFKDVPVFSGMHDCSGSALGAGCVEEGDVCIITGSWSGNDLVTDTPILDKESRKRWLIRSYAVPGKYLLMSSSPASFVNLDWFIRLHEQSIRVAAKADAGQSILAICDALVAECPKDEMLIYHPYLYGSQLIPEASAGFYGIRPWHSMAHFLRALYEGIAINHRNHFEAIPKDVAVNRVHVCGGGANSQVFLSILSAALSRNVVHASCSETTCLGAIIPVLVGLGIDSGYTESCRRIGARYARPVTGDPAERPLMNEKTSSYRKIEQLLDDYWLSPGT